MLTAASPTPAKSRARTASEPASREPTQLRFRSGSGTRSKAAPHRAAPRARRAKDKMDLISFPSNRDQGDSKGD
jgi:hypothetical protein